MWMWGLTTAVAAPQGTAEIPVAELLALHDTAPAVPAPPVAGALDRLDLKGRVLDDALEIEVSAGVSVLHEGAWTAVPLLDVGPQVALHDLPALTGAWLVVRDGTLTLLAKTAGTHEFTLGVTVQPVQRGREREVRLPVHPATSTSLVVDHDPGLVEVRPGASGVMRPRNGAYRLGWRTVGDARRVTEAAPTVAEPSVTQATSTVVSTLEGTWLVRTHYALSFQGREALVLGVPSGHEVERVFVNGRAVPVESTGHSISLEVAPARAGGDTGSVEVVLSGDRGGYLLQGELDVALPRISWPVTAWDCATHLPEVFDYAWRGGSMQQRDGDAASPAWSYAMPTPGTASFWRQELVFDAAPSLRLSYTVSLEGAYFRPEPTWAEARPR